ncbi:hypothetical protein AcV7_000193 [Taiwanofungus camphoratus]|nr:hypothetical protein AcV7_000193 [Antrodia cinnamomea]
MSLPALPSSPSLSLSTPSPVQATAESPIAVGQRVRFSLECVLIPDPVPQPRMPRLVKKSYTLPLWKKRGQDPSAISDSEQDSKDDDHIVFKVSVPRLTIKSRSPTRPELQPLVPCLMKHDSTSHASSAPRTVRRASMSPSPRLDLVTVPLRPCCPDCFSTAEACLKDGVEWTERFTSAARRRRNSSAGPQMRPHPHRRRLSDQIPGFGAIIAVDEVDTRRRSREFETQPPSLVDTGSLAPMNDDVLELPASLSRHDFTERHQASSGSNAKVASTTSAVLDEDHLFPLPTLRRRPTPVVQPVSMSHLVDSALSFNSQDSRNTPPSDTPVTSASAPIPSTTHTHHLDIPLPLVSSPNSDVPRGHSETTSSLSGLDRFPSTISSGRRRPLIHLPGPASFFKASAEVLKGVNVMSGGMPLPV